MKRIIKDGDLVFATGVFLQRNTSVDGGWVVESFEDDTYFDGELINWDEEERVYFAGGEEEDDDTF